MRLPIRPLLAFGGALVMLTAGFAYLSSNQVQQSSAGEGVNSVSGFNVTGIAYVIPCGNQAGAPACTGFGDGADYYNGSTVAGGQNATANLNAAYEGVTFTLTSQNAWTGPSTGPTNVSVYPENSSNFAAWGHDNGCSVSGWTILASGAGQGTVSCKFAPQVPAAQLAYLAVEANQ